MRLRLNTRTPGRAGFPQGSDVFFSKRPLAGVADAYNDDELAGFVKPVDDDVLTQDQPADSWIVSPDAPSHSRLIRKHPDSLEEILYDPKSRPRAFLTDELQELEDSLLGGIGPDDLIRH